MAKKPTYEELEQRVKELEDETVERKQAEEALRESEERFSLFMDYLPVVVFIKDEESRTLYVNKHMNDVLGAKDWIGKTALELFPKDIAEAMIADDKKALAEGYRRIVETVPDKQGINHIYQSHKFSVERSGKPPLLGGIALDVTEAVQREAQIMEWKHRYEAAILASGHLLYDWNSETNVVTYGGDIERMLGYSHDEMAGGLKRSIELIHPDDQDRFEKTIAHLTTTKEPAHLEYRVRKNDGKYLIVEDEGNFFTDSEGNIIRMVGFVKDITDKVQTDEALRESEDKYRNLVEESFDGIFIQKGPKIIFTNKRLNEMLGYREGELIGQNHWVIYHPDYQELTRERAQARMRGEEVVRRYEVKLQRKDGSWFYGEINARPIIFPSDKESGIQVWIKDIMEQKLAEETLRGSEERYRGLISNITDFIYSHDLEGRFITVNRAAAETLGYSPEDLIGRPISDFMLPEYRQAFKGDYLAHIKEKGSFDGISIYVAKDGSKHYLEYRSVLVKQEGLEPFVSGSGRDITERILSERKVQKLQEQLHRSQKMEALGLMAGGIAHDLNNILSGIVSYPELLLMDLPEDSPLRRPIKTIQESGMRAADVVSDLLTIARGVAIGKEVLNLNTAGKEYLDSAEHQKLEIAYPFVTFRPLLDPELLNIRCSPTHIKKTLMNLVRNASEAIEGSGTVTISTLNRYLDEPLKGYEDVRTGEYVVLGVSDDGSGIAPEDLERIFEPFYTKKIMGRSGTGLGLAVVWNTVQDHNGYINVNTGEKGTVFELYFPVTREDVAAEKGEVPLKDYLGHGEKILVVDDEERQREIAIGMLTKLGYNAEAVSSGEEAIEYVKENPVDLIVLDMVMPKGINGRETYEEIIKVRPGQKAIIASGYAKTKEVDTAQKLGAGHYIMKPYTLEKIGLAVKEELEK